jgi:hypothetical protein
MSWEIKSFRITHLSSSNVAWAADVRCYDVADPVRAGNPPESVLIRFYSDGAAIPADGWVHDKVNGVPLLNFPLSRYHEVMSTLSDTAYVSGTTFSYSFGADYVQGWGISSGPGVTGDMNPA